MTAPTRKLTHLERSSLGQVARGKLPDDVADPDDKVRQTASEHLASARRKLLARTTVEAVARAMKLGLID